jgi:hypothetical protein
MVEPCSIEIFKVFRAPRSFTVLVFWYKNPFLQYFIHFAAMSSHFLMSCVITRFLELDATYWCFY